MQGVKEDAPPPRVGLLTHGCLLARLYARYFPEDFDAELFDEVGNWLRRAGRGGWYILPLLSDRHQPKEMLIARCDGGSEIVVVDCLASAVEGPADSGPSPWFCLVC